MKLMSWLKAGSARVAAPVAPRATAQYLRDTRSGVIAARPASLTEHRDQVRAVWRRAAALAMDLIQNSGRLRGVVNQIIVDSCGTELSMSYQPNLKRFGYSDQEAKDWARMVRKEFRDWYWSAKECHGRGDWNIPQQADLGVKLWLAHGDACGVVDFMPPAMRARYGVKTGTKYSVFSPLRLVQDTSTAERLFQGVIRDENGRRMAYRCEVENEIGLKVKQDFPAFDAAGRQLFVHVFDPMSPEDERGISPLAATFRKYLMGENVDDATAQVQFLQTIYAVSLTSDRPSAEAFEALTVLDEVEGGKALQADMMGYFTAAFDKAAEGTINVGENAGVNHLAPGEKLAFDGPKVPGPHYQSFRASIDRETARALDVAYGSYTGDYTQATYASTNMENASLYPIAQRRTERLVAPHYQVPFESWLDESVAEGRIPFKGGYRAFAPNREALTFATWLGPARASADDEKAAKAQTERILNGTSSSRREASARGIDFDELFQEQVEEHNRYIAAGMPSPYERKTGSQPASQQTSATGAQAA